MNNLEDRFWQEGDEENIQAIDFTKGASWILSQDRFSITGWKDGIEDLHNKQIENKKYKIISNDTRYNALLRFMMFLGFLSPGFDNANSVLIDPTNAIKDELDFIFNNNIFCSFF